MKSTRRSAILCLSVAFVALAPAPSAAAAFAEGPGGPPYTFAVRHARVLRDRDGTLAISAEGVEYRSADGKHGGTWNYRELQRLEVLSKSRIRITTYEDTKLFGLDKCFTLEITGGELDREVSDFLRARMPKPFTTFFTDREGVALAELAVKHHHRLGGCEGTVTVYEDRVVFESDSGEGSRTWLWSDLRGVSRPNPYRLELATWEREAGGPKSYTFAVKEAMPDEAFEAIWQRIYRPSELRVAAPAPAEHRH